MNNRLALGTVQFGLPYGITNQAGQVSREEAAAILNHAWEAGIDTLDTAIAYGESEQRLGEIGVAKWRIVSKLPALQEPCKDVAGWVRESVDASLARLKVSRLSGLLLHRSQQLLSPQGGGLYRELIALKDQGKVEKIGISIYNPEELDALWPHYKIDLVQAPFNVIDRRLATSGWLTRLQQDGVEVHIRSVFLQGLLLVESAKRPAIFSHWQPLWDQWHQWLADQALTPLQGCLGFAMSSPAVDRVIVGVDNLTQLVEILSQARYCGVPAPAGLSSEDLDLVNPSRWVLAK